MGMIKKISRPSHNQKETTYNLHLSKTTFHKLFLHTLTMTDSSKFVLINVEGDAHFDDYLSFKSIPSNGRGSVYFHDSDRVSTDRLTFNVVERDENNENKIFAEATHVRTGYNFGFHIVYDNSGVVQFQMQIGADLAQFVREDLVENEDDAEEDGVYVFDELDTIEF